MTRRISVGILVFPGFQLLDIAGPKDAFAEVQILSRGAFQYDITTVGTAAGCMRCGSGLTVLPDYSIVDSPPQFDTVIVPGGLGVFDLLDDATVNDWLIKQSGSCRRLAAVCNGALTFGVAGLLQNRTVTTHWMDAPRLGTMVPTAKVLRDQIFVKDDKLYTTAGVSAGIDLALALIEEDCGKELALSVAKYLIVHVQRSGDQSQYGPLVDIQTPAESPIQRLQQFMLDNLTENHTVDSLATRAKLSGRQLSRVFSREYGITLMAFLSDARLDAAKRYLESTNAPLSEISRRCGFDGADALRQAFSRRLKISPLEYRSRFQSKSLSVWTGQTETGVSEE